MAVAKAQFAISEITELLRKKGVKVRFAVHPVAGRMPGQVSIPVQNFLTRNEFGH